MIKIFLDAATYIKVFSASFTGLSAMTTGGFLWVGNRLNTETEKAMRELDKKKEFIREQQRQLEKLRQITIP